MKRTNLLSVRTLTGDKIPNLPFLKIKEAILGKKYELSVVFVHQELSRAINKKYRGKNKPADILSFPYSARLGELVVGRYSGPLGPLVVHGLLHLKGLEHGSKMERMEKDLLRKLGF